ncbi:MAG TPA: EAL domain-containing protein, partial [Marinagarivorans sp.]|nr:EAL domain-containing protein [Marinagarivorans sp.]
MSVETSSPRRRVTDNRLPALEWQLVCQAFQNLPAMLMVNLSVSVGGGIVLYSDGYSYVYHWLALVIVMTVVRLAVGLYFNARYTNTMVVDQKFITLWKGVFAIGLFAAAGVWVAIAIATFTHQEIPPTSHYTLLIIMSAMASGATGITAPLKLIGRFYIAIMIIPAAIIMLFYSNNNLIIGVLGLVFCAAMIASHASNHRLLRASLTLKLENEQLVNNLQYLNSDLERRVNLRTQALKRIAHHDSLTGLPNRRGLIEWMENSLDAQKPQEAAILFLDLDRFKQINDALGHDVGDKVLQTIAVRFNDLCPANCILGRWGGDEFLLITQQRPDIRQMVEHLATQLIDAATAPLEMNNEKLGLGLSVGIAYFPTDARDYKDVIQAADLTVAEVKRNGRGQTLVYNDTYAETQRRRFDLSRTLAESIEHNKLHLVYQPIIDSHSGQVVALEVLCRWRHPVLGDINPDEFIRLAEDTDRIIALGDWALRTACQTAQTWGDNARTIKIAINVSIKQLLSNDYAGQVCATLKRLEFPFERLVLEVTETLFGEEYLDQSLGTVTQLRNLGIEVHIDDFGTGYSSLSRLHQFPVAAIKIDRSFIMQLDAQSMVIIESA